MVEVVCENCGHTWDYTGDKPMGAALECPHCGRTTELQEYSE